MKEQPKITELPEALLVQILCPVLDALEVEQFGPLALVCRAFHGVVFGPTVWADLELRQAEDSCFYLCHPARWQKVHRPTAVSPQSGEGSTDGRERRKP